MRGFRLVVRAGSRQRRFTSKPNATQTVGSLPHHSLRSEEVGFEPTDPCGPPVFKTGAIDHSATLP